MIYDISDQWIGILLGKSERLDGRDGVDKNGDFGTRYGFLGI